MKLAERAHVRWLLGAAAIGTLALVVPQLAAKPPPPPLSPRGCTVIALETPPLPESCPTLIREQLHVDADATAVCLHTGSTIMAYAYYRTTEWWERTAVFSDADWKPIVPLFDRPSYLAKDGDVVSHALVDGTPIREYVVDAGFRFEATPFYGNELGFAQTAWGPSEIADYDWSRVCDLRLANGELIYGETMRRTCAIDEHQTFIVRNGRLQPYVER